MSKIYTVSQQQIDEDLKVFNMMPGGFKPFKMDDQQLLELGRRVFNAISAQDFPGFIHDHEITEENNKPYKYLSRYPEGSKVLLIGVGCGREVLAAQQMGLDAYGVTLGRFNVEFATYMLGIDPTRIVECLAECLPYEPQTFDVVAAFQTFEHTVAPMVFLLEMSRVLKDDGHIVLEWPAPSDHSSLSPNPQHQVCCTPGQGKGLLLKSGFSDIELFYEDMTAIPEANYWKGEQDRGYIVSYAKKIDADRVLDIIPGEKISTVDYIKNARM
jgi:SAM-dependent methyltransferase